MSEERMLERPPLRRRGGVPHAEFGRAGDAAQGLPVAAAELLLGRGVNDATHRAQVLSPRLQDLRAPTSMAGFAPAIDLLVHARAAGWRVGVFGDYDVDGVTTTTILSTFLRAVGIEVVSRVATREGGYGFRPAAAREMADAGVDLVLTGDCGTSDHEALAWLEERGVPTVVIDHHQVPETMPPAKALLNPHQAGCEFPFKGMCSAGVAFYLCAALRSRLRKDAPSDRFPDPRAWLDLVALGTVCDMVPLVDENRILVRHGLRVLGERQRPGLRALLARAGVEDDVHLDEGHLGFQLGPRLNAPGRLSTAEPALSLLCARSGAEANALAAQVEALNTQRRAHQEQIVREAFEMLEGDPATESRAGIVVAGQGWKAGIVGIAASGIVERYRKPTLVLALDPSLDEARGSARSYGDIDVRAALAACSHLLTRFGGHKAAAGVSLAVEKVPALVEAFDQAVATQGGAQEDRGIEHDGLLSLERVDEELMKGIDLLAPYGVGFAAPLFRLEDATVTSRRLIKQKHLSLRLSQGGKTLEAMAFSVGDLPIAEGDKIGGLFSVGRRSWRGQVRLQMLLESIWRD